MSEKSMAELYLDYQLSILNQDLELAKTVAAEFNKHMQGRVTREYGEGLICDAVVQNIVGDDVSEYYINHIDGIKNKDALLKISNLKRKIAAKALTKEALLSEIHALKAGTALDSKEYTRYLVVLIKACVDYQHYDLLPIVRKELDHKKEEAI